jgi:AcrR family transcriptional regulator
MPIPRAAGRGTHPELPRRARAVPERRLQVRTAALELFAAHGYQATTIDEIGERVGIKGPSVYKHFRSKQDLLVDIMVETIDALIAAQRAAIRSGSDVRDQLRRAVEAHVRYHAEHSREAFVGGREIPSLQEPHRSDLLRKRAEYERRLRRLIEKGGREGAFDVASARLASFGILDLGTGVSAWYRPNGSVSVDDLVAFYAELALRMVGVPAAVARPAAAARPATRRRVARSGGTA